MRTYKVAVDREAGLFEQIVLPLLKQRNPEARLRAAGHDRRAGPPRRGDAGRAAVPRAAGPSARTHLSGFRRGTPNSAGRGVGWRAMTVEMELVSVEAPERPTRTPVVILRERGGAAAGAADLHRRARGAGHRPGHAEHRDPPAHDPRPA